MSRRATARLAAGASTALLLAGCGLPSTRSLIPARVRPRPATKSTRAPRATAKALPAPGQATLLQFAGTFTNDSARAETARQRRLIGLSAGPLAAELRKDAPQARLAVIRALPAGARMIGTAVIDQLAATGDSTEQGIVLVSERLQQADGASETPLISLYRATLRRTRLGWRVTQFRADR